MSELYKVVPYHDVMIDVELSEQLFSRLTDSISAGFRCGILPPTLEVNGLLCTRMWQGNDRRENDDPCGVCERACQSFPIKTVAAFECDEGHNDQQPQNCICLEVDEWVSFAYAHEVFLSFFIEGLTSIFVLVRLIFLSLDQEANDSHPQKHPYLNFLDSANAFVWQQNMGSLCGLYILVIEQQQN